MSDADRIPKVDVAPLIAGEDCPQTAAALRRAVQSAGFVYVQNHGISNAVIRHARESAMAFFLLPEAAKSEVTVSEHHRGWLPMGSARMADDVPADLKESFVWGDPYDSEQIPLDHSLRGPNQWPDQHIPELRQHATQWFDGAQHLASCLLRAFACSLAVDRNVFLRRSDRPLSRASFVYYPRQPASNNEDQFGVGPHTDFGVLTVLCQDDVGGLQIENVDGEWIDAPPTDNTLVVNVGDLLRRWTNGVFRSARHRVICPAGADRLSLVLAFDPNPETMIDAGELFADATTGADPVTCGDYLDWRFSRAFAYRR
jgi:isopenicillin N synthase-like dioxygenase